MYLYRPITSLMIPYLPSIPGFPGLSRVSASPPGIPEVVLNIPGYPGFQCLPPGILELVQISPVQHSHVHIMRLVHRTMYIYIPGSAVQPADRSTYGISAKILKGHGHGSESPHTSSVYRSR